MSAVEMIGPISSGVAVGGNGVATATGQSNTPVNGLLYAVYIKYLDAPPAGTTDVTIRTKGTNPNVPSVNFLVVTNGATDGQYLIRAQASDAAGAAIAGMYNIPPVADIVEVVIAGANAGDSVQVWLYVG